MSLGRGNHVRLFGFLRVVVLVAVVTVPVSAMVASVGFVAMVMLPVVVMGAGRARARRAGRRMGAMAV